MAEALDRPALPSNAGAPGPRVARARLDHSPEPGYRDDLEPASRCSSRPCPSCCDRPHLDPKRSRCAACHARHTLGTSRGLAARCAPGAGPRRRLRATRCPGRLLAPGIPPRSARRRVGASRSPEPRGRLGPACWSRSPRFAPIARTLRGRVLLGAAGPSRNTRVTRSRAGGAVGDPRADHHARRRGASRRPGRGVDRRAHPQARGDLPSPARGLSGSQRPHGGRRTDLRHVGPRAPKRPRDATRPGSDPGPGGTRRRCTGPCHSAPTAASRTLDRVDAPRCDG
jgi:hypothetical protein